MSNGPSYRSHSQLTERFWSKVVPDGDCWRWTSAEDDGYGKFWINGCNQYAHRLAYEDMVAEIPEGLQLDHLCRNRWCVNFQHLDPVPYLVNRRRRMTGHCKHDHEYTPENTLMYRGRRICRACNRRKARDSAQRRKDVRRAELQVA